MKEKPAWFDLRNYDDLKSFDLLDWYNRLCHRNWMYRALTGKLPYSSGVKQMWDESLIAIQHGVTKDSHFEWGRPVAPAVHDLSVEDVLLNYRFHDNFLKEERCLFEGFDDVREKILPDYKPGEAHIKLDLNASEEQIKKEFDAWLRAKKKKINVSNIGDKKPKFYAQSDMTEWRHYGILPFIDLWLWFNGNQLRINKAQLVAWLFPGGAISREPPDLHKVILPKAKMLLEPSTLRRIEKQLAHL